MVPPLTPTRRKKVENIPYVAMAWALAEQDSPAEVMEGCLLVVADTHEEAHDQIVEQIRHIGAVEDYAIVIRRAE